MSTAHRHGSHSKQRLNTRCEQGFSLVEAMMAILVLTTALVGMLAFLAQAIITTKDAQKEIIARQKSREIMESIFTARNTQQISFDQIQNEGAAPGAAFPAGYQDLRAPGPDGIVGTTD